MPYEEDRKPLQPTLISLFAIVVVASASVFAQQPRHYSREELISAAREIMTNARYCALITNDRTGRASSRAMDAFAPDEKMGVWLATNPRSRKVAEIRRNPLVTLYYFDRDHQAYVTLYGTARLVNDAKEKSRHWKDDWKVFYPDRDKSYLLIKITPERLEVVDTSKKIFSTSPSWQTLTVRFSRSK
jgi:general stress protein 26